jgi:hypothetical protein
MIQEHCLGRITDITEAGEAVIYAALPSLTRACDRKYSEVEIILPDGRRITPLQRKKCFALIGEVAEFVEGFRNAETVESTKEMLKWEFILERMSAQERRLFSLSNVDETTASGFIDYLVSFIIKHDIPTKVSLLENCEDIAKMVYACLMAKKCVCCGKPADLHHVDSVGAHGGNRDRINHLGLQCLPLCREHHMELHGMGNKDFMEKYHLQSVAIDAKIAKLYKLNTKERKSNE